LRRDASMGEAFDVRQMPAWAAKFGEVELWRGDVPELPSRLPCGREYPQKFLPLLATRDLLLILRNFEK
jgi:hypothetical protein